ncbi:MAG: hypothetical protein ACREDO_14050 [Methyloceanibacter sp.]
MRRAALLGHWGLFVASLSLPHGHGGEVGAYATYFNGGPLVDTLLKAHFLTLDPKDVRGFPDTPRHEDARPAHRRRLPLRRLQARPLPRTAGHDQGVVEPPGRLRP